MRRALLDLPASLHAESLKLRRTPALLVALIAPYLVALLLFFVGMSTARHLRRPEDAWPWLVSTALILWAGLLLPLLISLMTAFLADLESRHRQWKHLFALPVSRAACCLAKHLATVGLLALSMALLAVALGMAGLALAWLRPGAGFDLAPPWGDALRFGGAVFAAALLPAAIHTWLSLRASSFLLSISVGFAATVMIGLLRTLEGAWWRYFPWCLPANVMDGMEGRTVDMTWPLVGLVGGLAVALLAAWDTSRRDVT